MRDPKNVRPSPVRSSGTKTSPALLKETWTTLATLSGITFEQGKYRLCQQFELRTLAFLLTFDAASFESIMTPDIYNGQLLIVFLLIARLFQQSGDIEAAGHIWTFLESKYLPHYRVDAGLRKQAELLRRRYREEQPQIITSNEHATTSVPDLNEVLAALAFVRTSKRSEGPPEDMRMVLEGIEITANEYFAQQDFDTAKTLFDRLREKRAESLPNGEVEYLLACLDLGNCLRLKGGVRGDPEDLVQAEIVTKEAQSGLSRLVGEEDARTARAMFCLSSIMIFQNKFSEAEEQLSRVMVLYKKIDGNRIDKIMC
jgi:hypothetical protein